MESAHNNSRTNCSAHSATHGQLAPEYFAFFVPNRLLWTNWVKFMGEQDNPGDSISYTIPVCNPTTGYAVSSLQDYMGLITTGQNNGNPWSHSALPLRAYNQIYNAWFRDENLQNSVAKMSETDQTAPATTCSSNEESEKTTSRAPYRGRRKETQLSLFPGTTAPVNVAASIATGNSVRLNVLGTTTARQVISQNSGTGTTWGTLSAAGQAVEVFADLSTATAATINQLRQSFQIQRLLERDARGGTRYTEIIRSHFGVISPDARLQRPEYIGGGRTPIITNAVPQTSSTGLTGATTPMGTLAATGHAQGATGFTYSSTEHGYILVLASARADLTYQQGLRKLWSRSTRYDFYFPVFAMLGEQAVLNKEIYSDGSANDAAVFGYQERWGRVPIQPEPNHRHLPIHQRGNHRLLAQRAEIHSTADAERHVHPRRRSNRYTEKLRRRCTDREPATALRLLL